MHELLEAIVHLVEVALSPFTAGSEARKRWALAAGTVLALVGVLCLLGLLAWAALSSRTVPGGTVT